LRIQSSLGGFAHMIHRKALTRLEILVALIVGASAIGFILMLIVHHRENAHREQCKNNLRAIGTAFHVYHDTAKEQGAAHLPPSRLANGYATWPVLIAPYLMKENPLAQWDLHESYFAQPSETREARIIYYFCPARTRSDTLSQAGDVDAANKFFPGGLGDYASVAGDGSAEHAWTGPKANGALVIADVVERRDDKIVKWLSRTSFASLTRGESYTMVVGEKQVVVEHMGDAAFGDGSFYNGAHPASFSRVAGPGFPLAKSVAELPRNNFGSYHNGICNFLMADTSIRVMTTDTSEVVLGKLARRGD
jgi:hypothetical protein